VEAAAAAVATLPGGTVMVAGVATTVIGPDGTPPLAVGHVDGGITIDRL